MLKEAASHRTMQYNNTTKCVRGSKGASIVKLGVTFLFCWGKAVVPKPSPQNPPAVGSE